MNNNIVMHIITGLGVGGAERMLLNLICGDVSHQHIVVSLTEPVFFVNKLREIDVPVFFIKFNKKAFLNFYGGIRLIKLLVRYRPDVALCWMYHSCFLSIFLRVFYWGKIKLIWNIRHTPDRLDSEKKTTARVIRFLRFFSWLPSKIIYNSAISANLHEELGYASGKRIVIPNGFDVDHFKSKRFKSVTENFVCGHAARFHPMKDHYNLLQAFSLVLCESPNSRLLLCGRNVDWDNTQLTSWIYQLKLEGRVELLGEVEDMRVFYSSLDLFVLCSAWGEAFPNVVGEAMSCGISCVVTDVGDSGKIVEGLGEVVPPRNSGLLAAAIINSFARIAQMELPLSQAVRNHVIKNYSLPMIVDKYNEIY